MKSIDIREGAEEEFITEIVFSNPFSDAYSSNGSTMLGHLVTSYNNRVNICDNEESVAIESKEHALNLIKALHKAIELGWVK